MNASAPALDNASNSFLLRSRMAGIAILEVLSTDFANLVVELKQRLELAPGLFQNSPLALHIELPTESQSLASLVQQLQQLQLAPVAITQQSINAVQLANDCKLGVIALDKPTRPAEPAPAAPQAAASPAMQTKVVKQPIRSGQQVVSDGDLIVLGQVSAGAEIIAKGHIHVYGPLRGRAYAGAYGDESAHIFCRKLDAELVAIAGVFVVSDELAEQHRNQAVQIHLQDEKLSINNLDS